MRLAQAEAAKAEAEGEVPAGCIVVVAGDDGRPRVVGRAHNMTEALKDPTAHAEMLAITQATAAVGDWRLENAILYVTKEPCPMCGGAIVLARKRKYRLGDLIAQCDLTAAPPADLGLWESAKPVGQEVW